MDIRPDDLTQPFPPQPAGLGMVATDHPVIAIPFTAEIDGRQCKGEGLSLVRAEVAGLIDPALEGQERQVRLAFVFQGFTVALGVRARITGLGGQSGKAVLVFAEPTGDHLPQLRHLLNAWIANDIVSLGPILGIAASQTAGARAARPAGAGPSRGEVVQRLFGTVLLLAAAVGLVAAVATLTYARLYTTVLPVPAQIMAEGQMLTALTSGQIDYLNPAATKGDIAFTLRSESGQVLSVAMPCDCSADLQGLMVGATVQAGDPVLLVHAAGAAMLVQAAVPSDRMFDLARADSVTLELADGTRLTAVPQQPLPMPAQTDAPALVTVTLVPDQALSADLAGALARVTIAQPVPVFLEPARALYRAFGG